MAIEFNVDQALAKLGELVAKHGPDVVDFAAQVKRAEGIAELAVSVAALGVGAAGLTFAYRRLQALQAAYETYGPAYRIWDKWNDHRNYPSLYKRPDGDEVFDQPRSPSWMWGVIVPAGFVGAIAGLNGLIGLLSPWTWIAAFAPKLALAHDIMQRVTGQ